MYAGSSGTDPDPAATDSLFVLAAFLLIVQQILIRNRFNDWDLFRPRHEPTHSPELSLVCYMIRENPHQWLTFVLINREDRMSEGGDFEDLEKRVETLEKSVAVEEKLRKLEETFRRWRWFVFTVIPAIALLFGVTAVNLNEKLEKALHEKEINDIVQIAKQASVECMQDKQEADIDVQDLELKKNNVIADGSAITLENVYYNDHDYKWLRVGQPTTQPKDQHQDEHLAWVDTGNGKDQTQPNLASTDYEVWKIHIAKPPY